MSREIEYRAKDKSGKWVYGHYASGVYDCGAKVHYIVSDLTHIMSSCWGVDAVDVDPDTLGQYTGIKDKNGVKIFEGDVVVVTESGTNGFSSRHEVVNWTHENYPAFDLCPPVYDELNSFSAISSFGDHTVEVIGNIHEVGYE